MQTQTIGQLVKEINSLKPSKRVTAKQFKTTVQAQNFLKQLKSKKGPRVAQEPGAVSKLAAEKGISPKAVRAFLRRHFDHKEGEPWTITAAMRKAVMEAGREATA